MNNGTADMHSLYKCTYNLSNINSKHRVAAMFVSCSRTSDILYITTRALKIHLRTKFYISSRNGWSVIATKPKAEKIFCLAIIFRAINKVPQEE
jgi:hypothetical protein